MQFTSKTTGYILDASTDRDLLHELCHQRAFQDSVSLADCSHLRTHIKVGKRYFRVVIMYSLVRQITLLVTIRSDNVLMHRGYQKRFVFFPNKRTPFSDFKMMILFDPWIHFPSIMLAPRALQFLEPVITSLVKSFI